MGDSENSYLLDDEKPIKRKEEEGEEVKDKYGLCLFYATIFGISTLLPWNAFITANSFFMYKLDSSQYLKDMFYSTLSVCSNIPLIVGFFLNTLYVYRLNKNARAFITLIIILLGFIELLVFVKIDTSKIAISFFVCVMLTCSILSLCTSIAQSLFYGILAFFPPRYIQCFLIGQSVAGIMITMVNILIILSNQNNEISAFIYFSTAVLAILISIIAYAFMLKNDYYKFLVPSDSKKNIKKQFKFIDTLKIYYKIFCQVKYSVITVFMAFFCTLTYFPGFTLRIASTSTNSEWNNKYFLTVYCFLIFNVGDLVGRTATKLIKWPSSESVLLPIFSILRFLFFFLFAICNIQGKSFFPILLNHDAFPMIIMFFFSFTNGYLPTIAFSEASSLVLPEEAEMCNNLLALALGFGLATGSFVSFALTP